MTTVTVSRKIDAPLEVVFDAVAAVEKLPEVNSDVVAIQFISEINSGVGTRFRETRLMDGKQEITELEITECDPPRSIRMVADSHGTVWDSVFTVVAEGGQHVLTIVMEARPYKLLPKLLNPLFKGFIKKGLDNHLGAVKSYCEQKPR